MIECEIHRNIIGTFVLLMLIFIALRCNQGEGACP
jgi:hypothetical protein